MQVHDGKNLNDRAADTIHHAIRESTDFLSPGLRIDQTRRFRIFSDHFERIFQFQLKSLPQPPLLGFIPLDRRTDIRFRGLPDMDAVLHE